MSTGPYSHIGKSNGNFDRCVIDVGCHQTGYRGKFFKQRYNLPAIFIDADLSVLKNFQAGPEDLVIHSAVSSRNGIAKFYIYPHEGTPSLCEVDLDNCDSWKIGSRNCNREEWIPKEVNLVPMITLADLIETVGIKSIPAIKIDAQGHDFEVIKGLKEYLNIIDYLELEVQVTKKELYKNSSKKDEVMDYMLRHGFEFSGNDVQSLGQEQNLYFSRRKA